MANKKPSNPSLGLVQGRVSILGIGKTKNFFYVFFDSKNLDLRSSKKMEITKKEEKSLIDITLLDNEFFVEMLNRIIAHKKSEVQNGLPKN